MRPSRSPGAGFSAFEALIGAAALQVNGQIQEPGFWAAVVVAIAPILGLAAVLLYVQN